MIARMIEGVTRICGKSQGYLGLPVRDVVLNEKVNGSDVPAMQTAWEPTPDELEALKAGGSVLITLLGTAPMPMLVSVEGPL